MILYTAFFVAIGSAILPAQAIKQMNSTIISEQIIYHPNDYLSLEITGDGEDSIIFINIDRPIDADDDILIKMRLKHGDETFLMPMLDEVNLCTLLRTEANEPDGLEATYMMSQAFNLNGYQCPIKKTVLKLTPWILTRQHNFAADLPCGIYKYELTLEQCRPFVSCRPLIVAELDVSLTSDDCY